MAKESNITNVSLSRVVIALLVLANLAYLPSNPFASVITLVFFALVPGYLLLNLITQGVKSRWETLSLSLGLSLVVLMASGLALNSLHFLGVDHPLMTASIFAVLDVVTLALLWPQRRRRLEFTKPATKLSKELILVAVSLTLLPFLAIFGAIRLNNGSSGVLTMILFGTIPVIFLWLIARRKQLELIYPYGVFVISLSVLLATSLRGWHITGHDIQLEFQVFRNTLENGFWRTNSDPYNACLSITILPTLLAKISALAPEYIYKALFQVFFAVGTTSVYFIAKRFGGPSKALLAAFIFVMFPTFLNDMSFLNRQEIAFVLFGLLALVNFSVLTQKPKTILSLILLCGITVSHYSTGYTTLLLFLVAWAIHKIMTRRNKLAFAIPILRLSVLSVALIFTFLWNIQITGSTSNLSHAITGTINGFMNGAFTQNTFVKQYGLWSPSANKAAKSTQQQVLDYAGDKADQITYTPYADLPVTKIGRQVSTVFDVRSINYFLHSFIARILQVLLILGAAIFVLRRNKQPNENYFAILAVSSLILLAIWTLMPAISVDYTPTRLFQQLLIVVALPMAVASEFFFGFARRFRTLLATLLISVLFLNLTGFASQLTGGYLPQLSLNNSGMYYASLYTHGSDVVSGNWLAANRRARSSVFMDTWTSSPSFIEYPIYDNILHRGNSGYLQLQYINVTAGTYRTSLEGAPNYRAPNLTNGQTMIYSSQGARIYGRGY